MALTATEKATYAALATQWQTWVKNNKTTAFTKAPAEIQQAYADWARLNYKSTVIPGLLYNYFQPFLNMGVNIANWPALARNQYLVGLATLAPKSKSLGSKIVSAVNVLENANVALMQASINPVKDIIQKPSILLNPIEGTKKSISDARAIVRAANDVVIATNPLDTTLQAFNEKGIAAGGVGKILGSVGETARKNPIETTALVYGGILAAEALPAGGAAAGGAAGGGSSSGWGWLSGLFKPISSALSKKSGTAVKAGSIPGTTASPSSGGFSAWFHKYIWDGNSTGYPPRKGA